MVMLVNKANAQKLTVESLQVLAGDLSARTSPMLDLNGNACALLKIWTLDSLVDIQGNYIGLINHKTAGEKWIYITAGSRELKLFFDKHLPISLKFSDFGINELKSSESYLLILAEEGGSQSITSEQQPEEDNLRKEVSEVSTNSLSAVESILGCRFAPLEEDVMKKLKLDEGLKVIEIKKGPFKEAKIKENFIVQKINDQSISSINDIINLYERLQDGSSDTGKVLILSGIYPNGRKGYYAVAIP